MSLSRIPCNPFLSNFSFTPARLRVALFVTNLIVLPCSRKNARVSAAPGIKLLPLQITPSRSKTNVSIWASQMPSSVAETRSRVMVRVLMRPSFAAAPRFSHPGVFAAPFPVSTTSCAAAAAAAIVGGFGAFAPPGLEEREALRGFPPSDDDVPASAGSSAGPSAALGSPPTAWFTSSPKYPGFPDELISRVVRSLEAWTGSPNCQGVLFFKA